MRSPTPRRRALLTYVSIAAISLSMAVTACSAPTPGPAPGTSVEPVASTPAAASSSPTSTRFSAPPAQADDFEGAETPDDTSYKPDDWEKHRWPGDTPETDPVGRVAGDDRAIDASYRVSGPITLRDGWFRGTGKWSEREGNVDTVKSEWSFVVRGPAPGFMYRHRIYENDKPTDFWLGTKFGSPEFGSNQWNCDVFRGDPAGEGEWAWVSPYVCNWDNNRGFNPMPVLTVKKATVVTNKRDAGDLLSRVCNAGDGQRRCRYFNVGFGKGIGERKVVGSVIINPGSAKGTKTVKWTEKNGTTNSAGVDISASFKIAKIFSFEVSAHYSHEWLWEHTFGDDTQIELESESAQWVEYAAPYQTAIGNWVVDDGEQTYLVPDITLKSPLTDGGRTYVMKCPLEEYNDDGTCNVQPWSKLVKR